MPVQCVSSKSIRCWQEALCPGVGGLQNGHESGTEQRPARGLRQSHPPIGFAERLQETVSNDKVEGFIYYTRVTLDSEHILKSSTEDLQKKLDECARDGWRPVSTSHHQLRIRCLHLPLRIDGSKADRGNSVESEDGRRTRGSVVTFVVLTYALMWAFFISVAASGYLPSHDARRALVLLGTSAPSLIALCLTARAEGAAGVRTLLRSLLHWRVSAQWYLFATGYIAVIKLTVALVHRVIAGSWPAFGGEPWYLIPLAIAFSTPFQAGEEIGWRGYALPRLAERFGIARASLLLGLDLGLLAPASILHSRSGYLRAVLHRVS